MVETLGAIAAIITIGGVIWSIYSRYRPGKIRRLTELNDVKRNIDYYFSGWQRASLSTKCDYIMTYEEFRTASRFRDELKNLPQETILFLFVCSIVHGVWKDWFPKEIDAEKIKAAIVTLMDGRRGWRPIWRAAFIVEELFPDTKETWYEEVPQELSNGPNFQQVVEIILNEGVVPYLVGLTRGSNQHLLDKAYALLQEIDSYSPGKVPAEYNKANVSGAEPESDPVVEQPDASSVEWDFFICHASEDKDEIVEPLAIELQRQGLRVWYDRWSLKIGDSLREKIDEGLRQSRYGIVVLSPYFFKKEWPQKELDGLFQKESEGEKIILPIWHNLDTEDIRKYSLILADRIGVSTSRGMTNVSHELLRATDIETSGPVERVDDAQPPQVAAIEIDFHKRRITNDLHEYDLIVRVGLKVPPDQGRLRFKMFWPFAVPVIMAEQFAQIGRNVRDHEVETSIYELNWDERIFPGETRELIGPNATAAFRYKVNDDVYRNLEKQRPRLRYELYFEDHDPLTGALPLDKLHVY